MEDHPEFVVINGVQYPQKVLTKDGFLHILDPGRGIMMAIKLKVKCSTVVCASFRPLDGKTLTRCAIVYGLN